MTITLTTLDNARAAVAFLATGAMPFHKQVPHGPVLNGLGNSPQALLEAAEEIEKLEELVRLGSRRELLDVSAQLFASETVRTPGEAVTLARALIAAVNQEL